jgi:hypothetical protein
MLPPPFVHKRARLKQHFGIACHCWHPSLHFCSVVYVVGSVIIAHSKVYMYYPLLTHLLVNIDVADDAPGADERGIRCLARQSLQKLLPPDGEHWVASSPPFPANHSSIRLIKAFKNRITPTGCRTMESKGVKNKNWRWEKTDTSTLALDVAGQLLWHCDFRWQVCLIYLLLRVHAVKLYTMLSWFVLWQLKYMHSIVY